MKEKKEKIELNSEEKMKKKFRKLRKIMIVIEGFLMVVPLLLIFVAIIVGFSVIEKDVNEDDVIIVDGEVVEEENIDLKKELLDVLESDLEKDEDYQNASESLKTLMAVSTIIAAVIDYVFAIIITDYLAKIFGETEKQGTPFTEKNIKLLKKVNIVAILLWLAGMMGVIDSIGLVFVIIISAFRTIFEYGYKLQKESDETL